MTWVGTAGIDAGAGHLWQGVRPRARGTGALGSLVLWQADSIDTTCVSSAHIHTLVAQSVTELAGRTVCVGETADSLAAHHRVSGVSFELARRTGAPGRMILSDADSLGAAGDGVAGGDTLLEAGAAHLLLSTLGI